MKVLVVDDEPLLARALVRLLGTRGIAATTAEHGLQALQRLEEQRFSLVVCDVRMPVMDGPTLLAEMRRRGIEVPLVFLTGYGDRSDRELRAAGALEVLGKPLLGEELFAAVARHARPPT